MTVSRIIKTLLGMFKTLLRLDIKMHPNKSDQVANANVRFEKIPRQIQIWSLRIYLKVAWDPHVYILFVMWTAKHPGTDSGTTYLKLKPMNEATTHLILWKLFITRFPQIYGTFFQVLYTPQLALYIFFAE